MVRKYHNHKLQTNPWTVKKSHWRFTRTRHLKDNQGKATSSLFLVKMIAELERTKHNNCPGIQFENNVWVATLSFNIFIKVEGKPPHKSTSHCLWGFCVRLCFWYALFFVLSHSSHIFILISKRST